jgi:predicted ATPase
LRNNSQIDLKFKWENKLTSLRSWKIESFKSVAHNAHIDLAPLTVVVGANSSGKSTLIQSILLMAQNALRIDEKSASKNKGLFELNGPLVQLGTFEETSCDLLKQQKPFLGFGATWFGGDRLLRTPVDSYEEHIGSSVGLTRIGDHSLVWEIKLRPFEKSLDSGVAALDESMVEFYRKGVKVQSVAASSKSKDSKVELLKSKYERFSFDHMAKIENFQTKNEAKGDKKQRYDAVYFQSGFPISGLEKRNVVDYIFDSQTEALSKAINWGEGLLHPDEDEQLGIPKYQSITELADKYVAEIAECGKRIVQQDRTVADKDFATLSNLIERRTLIPLEQFPESTSKFFGAEAWRDEGEKDRKLADEAAKFFNDFVSLLKKRFDELHGDSEWAQEFTYCLPNGRRSANPANDSSGQGQFLHSLVKRWNRYLSENVLYLGPLRVGPRATYGLGSSAENYNIPLGESGEYLAKKLFTDKTVKAYPIVENGQLRDAMFTLEEAVTFWYQEISATGESTAIDAEAPNRQGYPLKIGKRTLANVGFGASQILPVLGLCLSASPGDLILLEQPELHLNPGMQQKLADFLLVMSKTGRQIIVETHSEYLITRLRRNAASSSDAHQYFTIIYVERDPETGTTYRTVNVDDQGDLSEWPKGFFDHVAEDLRVLMRRAAERQRSKAEQ